MKTFKLETERGKYQYNEKGSIEVLGCEQPLIHINIADQPILEANLNNGINSYFALPRDWGTTRVMQFIESIDESYV